MRLGPGKHLKGLVLMGGIVKPEEFDYFHEVCTLSLTNNKPTKMLPAGNYTRIGTDLPARLR